MVNSTASEAPTRSAVRALALLALLLPTMAAARETVTLPQALERAFQVDPRVVQAQGNKRIAAAVERSARGAYLPTFDAHASTSVAGATPNRATEPGLGAGVSANWDVFTGFRRSGVKAQARSGAEAADASLAQQRSAVGFGVEQTFFAALRAVELQQVARARERRAQEGADAANRKASAGAATRSDVLRAELELNTARQSLLEATTQREAAAFALGRLVGAQTAVDPLADPAAVEAGDAVVAGDYVREVMTASPDVLRAQAQVRSATAGVSVARSRYYPQVALGAGYDVRSDVDPLFAGGSAWSVRLGVSFPVFDGFGREEASERARVQEVVAASSLSDTERLVRAEAERLLGELELAQERIALAEEATRVAAEDLRVQQERYRMGVTTMLDLLTSQAAVVEAETNLVSARFDYRLSRANLKALAGGYR